MSLNRLIDARGVWMAHAVLVLSVSLWVGFRAAALGFGVVGVLLCCASIVALALAPRHPVLALGSFVVAAGVLPRYGVVNLAVLSLGLLNWLALLGLSGWAVWLVRSRARPPMSHGLSIGMLLFVAWGGLSMALAAPDLQIQSYSITHHPEAYLQAAVLMFIASTLLAERTPAVQVALLMCAVPVVRGVLQTKDGIYLDGDVALIALMGLPFALLGAASRWLPWWQRAGLAIVAAQLLRIVLMAQNRGAALGLAFALMALWLGSRHKLRWLAAALPLGLVVAALIPQGYVDRFSVLWNPAAGHATASLDRATIDSRLQLWRAGAQIVQDHPWFGVGPGNFPKALAVYLPASEGNVAHNSVLSVAAETGFAGAAFFVFLFAGGLVGLQRLILSEPPGWQLDMARAVQASLAGWVGAGLVLTRQNMPLAYLLLGWTVALLVRREALTRERKPAPA
jgi:O-antigen ligase